MLFFGMAFSIQALIHCFCEGLWLVGPRYILQGNMDYHLIRPFSALFLILMGHMHSSGLINLGFGIFFLRIALGILDISVGWYGGLILAAHMFFGFLISFSFLLVLASLAFYLQRVTSLLRVFLSFQQLLTYPLDLFPSFFLMIFTFVLPASFVSFFPLIHFLDPASSPGGFFLPQATVASGSLALGLVCWNKGLRGYQGSAG